MSPKSHVRQAGLGLATTSLILALTSAQAFALITGGSGNDPMGNRGWPAGTEKLTDLPSRLGWWEGPPFGGGEYHFLYRCKDTAQFNDVLKLFAEIQLPKASTSAQGESIDRPKDRMPQLVVLDGPGQSFWLGRGPDEKADKEKSRLDWELITWLPSSWNNLYNMPDSLWSSDQPNFRHPVPPPAINVYITKGGPIVWEQVKVPPGIHVTDKRASAASSGSNGVIKGNVYDIATHQPIADVAVILKLTKTETQPAQPIEARTDGRGWFKIEKAPAGAYTPTFQRDREYAARSLNSWDNRGTDVCEVVVFLARAGALAGIVNDVQGKPIAGVKVAASNTLGIDGMGYPGGGQDTTDENGLFEITGLPSGFAQLRASAEGLHQQTPMLQTYRVPSDNIILVMTGTGIVRGKVVPKEGQSLPKTDQFHITIVPAGGSRPGTWGGGARCDAEGRFEFKGVPPGEYLLSTNPLLHTGDDTGAVRVKVESGKTIEITVTHEQNRPARYNRPPWEKSK
jgi:hypothetical protein